MNKLKYFPILFTIAIAVCSAPFAQAIIFPFTSDHTSDGAGTPPFGQVELTQNGTSVNFTVTLFDGSVFVKTGAGDSQYFKFNAIGITLADIVNLSAPSNPAFPLAAAGPGNFNGDGTGPFAWAIGAPLAGNGAPGQNANPISFTVLNSVITDFTTPNVNGFVFVADILSGQTGNTGPVDASTPSVPDGGATVMLLGAALGALGMARRFLKR
jgi:protein with PEP-CTERM/exosortase system signal